MSAILQLSIEIRIIPIPFTPWDLLSPKNIDYPNMSFIFANSYL